MASTQLAFTFLTFYAMELDCDEYIPHGTLKKAPDVTYINTFIRSHTTLKVHLSGYARIYILLATV